MMAMVSGQKSAAGCSGPPRAGDAGQPGSLPAGAHDTSSAGHPPPGASPPSAPQAGIPLMATCARAAIEGGSRQGRHHGLPSA